MNSDLNSCNVPKRIVNLLKSIREFSVRHRNKKYNQQIYIYIYFFTFISQTKVTLRSANVLHVLRIVYEIFKNILTTIYLYIKNKEDLRSCFPRLVKQRYILINFTFFCLLSTGDFARFCFRFRNLLLDKKKYI